MNQQQRRYTIQRIQDMAEVAYTHLPCGVSTLEGKCVHVPPKQALKLIASGKAQLVKQAYRDDYHVIKTPTPAEIKAHAAKIASYKAGSRRNTAIGVATDTAVDEVMLGDSAAALAALSTFEAALKKIK